MAARFLGYYKQHLSMPTCEVCKGDMADVLEHEGVTMLTERDKWSVGEYDHIEDRWTVIEVCSLACIEAHVKQTLAERPGLAR